MNCIINLFKIQILFVGLLMGQQVVAEASGPDFYQIKIDTPAGKAVPLYEDHSLDSDLVSDNVPRESRLKNLGCTGIPDFQTWSSMSEEARKKAKDDAWCKVSYEGYEGWIQNLYLTEYGELVKTDSQSEWSEGPAFDCQKAQGSIETLVCKEPELAELDRKMDTVYQAALAAAKSLDDRPERAVKYLKASQRGWIKGRNECWKEPDDQFGCTKKEYQRRIALLQASWSLVNASEAVRYVCADQREEFYVTSYETDGVPAVAVEYGDTRQPLVLWKDSLYTGEKGRAVTLNGEQATLSWGPSQPDKVCRQP